MPQTEAGRVLLESGLHIRIHGQEALEAVLAIETEARQEADALLRRLVAVVDAAGMVWTGPVPNDAIAAIHDAKEYLAAADRPGK